MQIHKVFFSFFLFCFLLGSVVADPLATADATISVDVEPTCGDGVCSGSETCSNCESDCGCSSNYYCSGSSCRKKSSGGSSSSSSSSSSIIYTVDDDAVIENYSHENLCTSMCGDGVCSGFKCLEKGCPCIEDEIICALDCKVDIVPVVNETEKETPVTGGGGSISDYSQEECLRQAHVWCDEICKPHEKYCSSYVEPEEGISWARAFFDILLLLFIIGLLIFISIISDSLISRVKSLFSKPKKFSNPKPQVEEKVIPKSIIGPVEKPDMPKLKSELEKESESIDNALNDFFRTN